MLVKTNTTTSLLQESIAEARAHLNFITDSVHDVGHARRTAENAAAIGEAMGYKNLELLELCGWWHDVGRLIDPPDHERISAELARSSVIRLGGDQQLGQCVHQAIAHHKWSMNPTTLEGQIVRDADKLDWLACERWETCIHAQQADHLCTSASMLPQLYDLLELAPSKQLYKQRIQSFTAYLNTLESEDAPYQTYAQTFLSQPLIAI